MDTPKILYSGILVLALFLTGCATTGNVVTNQVKVSVPVPCNIQAPAVPIMPLDSVSPDETDIFVIEKSALAEIEVRKGYETKLVAVIDACNNSDPIFLVTPSVPAKE